MYDIVNNKFYTNQGTGTFEKGNNVWEPGKWIENIDNEGNKC